MRIVVIRILLPVLFAAALLSAQTRDAYEQAYRDWRLTDPNLERDAAKGGDALPGRADKVAAAAGKFIAARKAFYDAQRGALAEKPNALKPFELPMETEGSRTAEAYLSAQEVSVTNSIQVFGGDPDRGIQLLKQSLEKERAALASLRSAIKIRESAMNEALQANENADRSRSGAADQIKAILASFEQSNQDAGQLAEAWPAYYRAVANGARGIGLGDTMPPPAIRPSNSTPSSAPSPPVASGRPAPVVPISRYTGSWSFLPGVSTYHGLPPVSFEVSVREENGGFIGTVNARFIVTGNADPAVRFDFSGPLQTSRYQAFPLQTPEGAKGKIELIPGNAFNLMEVNYTLDGAPGKVRESDVILVKR